MPDPPEDALRVGKGVLPALSMSDGVANTEGVVSADGTLPGLRNGRPSALEDSFGGDGVPCGVF